MDNAEQKSEWSQRELGALWKRESPNQKYLTGRLQVDGKDVNVVVFMNKHKTKENQPDFRVYRSKDRDEVSSSNESVASSEPQEELL
tara:strand:- start:3456 stop:3716 length:261 start_codon:yes stop_codon:yes gene_type:complete